MGGTIYQDIYSQIKDNNLLKHQQEAPRWYPSHNIKIMRNSRIFDCFGTESAKVNSFHHQAIKDVAIGYKVTADSSDGVIEAIEYIGEQFAVGVQWHPETMWEKDIKYFEIFKVFVDSCIKNK
jgi:Predicted glutamine amidotransferases